MPEATRARAEQALQQSESILRGVFDAAGESIWVFDLQGVALAANRTALERWGAPAEQVIGRCLVELLPPELGQARLARLQEVARTGRSVTFEDTRAGLVFEHTFQPVVGPDGRIDRIAVFSRDVTQRRRSEEALRESDLRFRLALQSAPVSIAAQDRDLRFLWAFNQRTVRSADVIGKTDTDLFPPEDAARLVALKRRVLESGEELRERLWVNSGGRRVFVDLFLEPTRDAAGRVIGIGIATVDLTEMKRAEEALREVDQRKDEFLGVISHELRNPLAPIRNSVYLLEHVEPSSPQALRAREVIRRQAEHLSCLVDDLLDVTRMAHGRLELRRAQLDLREVVARAGEDQRSVVEANGARLEVDLPAAPAWVDADATRVCQIVGNLLQNAAKFTRRGDLVALSLVVEGGAAEIEVRDTGAGIDPALLPSIFQPYVQSRRTLERSDGGLGLGLALVKGLAELHGGEVRVESDGVGHGAAFRVRLPLVATAEAAARPVPARKEPARGRRVLVVDDNRDGADSLAEVVEMLGHQAEVAYDGPAALEKARANPPDLVFCDLGLPVMSGYVVAQALRAQGFRMPLVALTGYAHPDGARLAAEAGFTDHLTKPVDLAVIERMLGA